MAVSKVVMNVEQMQAEGWEKSFPSYIKSLRSDLGVRVSHGRPVLAPQQNPPTKWFICNLYYPYPAYILVRFRRDSFYLDAYQMKDSHQLLEFGSDTTNPPSPHLIEGSSFLGFDGDYDSLQRAAGVSMANIELGEQQLSNAMAQLATSTNRQVRARSLIVFIQMVCESVRFHRITNHLASSFGNGFPAPDWMLALERGWQDLSATLLRSDVDPNYQFRIPQPSAMQIETTEQAVDALGVIMDTCSPHSAPHTVLNDGMCLQGRPLVEVISVRVNNIDDENQGDLYGTITVTDGLGSQYIYNRKREDSESIHPRDTALLTGPARSISAYGSFTINLTLMHKSNNMSSDQEVSNGKISWNVFNTTNEYEKLLFNGINGKYGSVTLNYLVLSNAVQASVEVILINGDGENPANVYGLLTAYNSKFLNEGVIFQKASTNFIDVRPGQPIPLSRSVVAVPLNSSLNVRADLWDRDRVFSPDDEIAKGTAEFPAQLSGTSEKNIYGKYGEIKVKVTWSWDI